MSRLKPLVIAVLSLAIVSCSSVKNAKNQGYTPEQLSEQDRTSLQNQQQLDAAASLLKANNLTDAQLYAETIERNGLSSAELSALELLQAQISLAQKDIPQALKHMLVVEPNQLSADNKVAYFRSRATLYAATGKQLESAKARIALQPLLSDATQQHDNKTAILDSLRQVPLQSLTVQTSSPQDELGGWVALAKLLKQSSRLSANDPKLIQWQNLYPNHPVSVDFLNGYILHHPKAPGKIAIFLPETGEYSQAAKAIKAGFMAAHKQNSNGAASTELQFYDSANSNPVSLYHKAIDEGANLIIGPLNKDQIEQLSRIQTLDIPILTLNHIPGLTKANLYQFALSPIDEADQVAQQAVNAGHKRVMLLTPKSELGERMEAYFEGALRSHGGSVIKSKQYKADNSNIAATLKDMLNQGEGENRYAQLKRLLPTLQYTPKSRDDIDALIITAYPANAKVILTQLQALSKSQHIPVYATPQVFSGVNSSSTTDLNDLTFCDIPWVFNSAYQGDLSKISLINTWQAFPEVLLRLVAMGIDAYQLIPHLSQLSSTPLQGATGKLRLTEDNRIQRQLVCATFNHTQPEVIP